MDSSTHEIPVVSYRSSISIESDLDESAGDILDQINDEERSGRDGSDEQLACCWLDKRLTAGDLLFSVPLIALGVSVIAWGFTNPGENPDDAARKFTACLIFGVVALLMGLAILLLRVLVPSEGIEVTRDGIARITKKRTKQYRWDEIHKVKTIEFTATRFSETQTVAAIQPVKGRTFSFDTSYAGDPLGVLATVLTSCDYIVRNPEGYTRNDK